MREGARANNKCLGRVSATIYCCSLVVAAYVGGRDRCTLCLVWAVDWIGLDSTPPPCLAFNSTHASSKVGW